MDLIDKKVRGYWWDSSGFIKGTCWVDEQPLGLQEWMLYEIS